MVLSPETAASERSRHEDAFGDQEAAGRDAYVDVVGLKHVNDTRGRTAGDALLRRVVEAIRAQLRSCDLSVRLGGDDFLYVLPDATLEDATRRFGSVQAALAADPDPAAIRVGCAALAPGERADELVQRADRARTKLHDR